MSLVSDIKDNRNVTSKTPPMEMLGIGVYKNQLSKIVAEKNPPCDISIASYPRLLQIQRGAEYHRSRDLYSKSEIKFQSHNAVVTDLPIPAFSSTNFGLNVAS